jgi:hypothetical protein
MEKKYIFKKLKIKKNPTHNIVEGRRGDCDRRINE